MPNIDGEEDNDDDDILRQKRNSSPRDLIFADSKSSRFKEKNVRKQKKWSNELEQHKIVPKTPLSKFAEEAQTKSENKIIQ